MDAVIGPLTVGAAVGSGLIAGLFFVFSVAIMPALARIPGAAAVAAMQAINVVIVRPSFLVPFLGTAAAAVVLAVLAPDVPHVLAAACYLIGTMTVTAAANVPLNNVLDRVRADSAEAESLWPRYLARWSAWNHVRTVSSTAATLAFVLAC